MAEIQRQGPATFALDNADQPVQASPVPQPVLIQNAQPAPIAPGLSAGAPGVNDGDSRTFRAITDLASGVLAPKIKEAAQSQFITGVQKAMTGEALSEIAKDQPWYSNIFAPSSALAGARAYTSQQAVAQWAGKMQDDMHSLAKVGPEDLRNAAVGALQGFLTGDPAADAQITGAVAEHMAPLFKQHAKEHYIYVQKQASMAQIGSWEAAAKVYQGFAAAGASGAGTVSPEDVEAAKTRMLASVAPFADQPDESYQRNILAFMEGAAGQGNFQVIKAFKENGLYDMLPPDHRAQLDRNLKVFGRQALDKAMPTFALDVAKLVNDMTQNPKDIVGKVQALNDKAAAATGVSEAQLIPLNSLDNIIGHVMNAQAHAADAAARAIKEPSAGPAIARALMFTVPGGVDQAEKAGLIKKDELEQVGYEFWTKAASPAEKAKVLNARTLAPFDMVKSELVNTLRTEEFNPGVGNMAQVYAGLAEDVKPHYFDEHQRALLDRFNASVRADMPPDAAWVTAKANPSIAKYIIHDSDKDEMSVAIRNTVERANEYEIMGINTHVNKIDDAALRTAMAATMKAYKADRTNNPPDIAAKRAWTEARANGLDIQGRHAVINVHPQDAPLFRVVGEGQKDTADAFEALMAEKAKAQGAKLDNYEALRVPDVNGQAYIHVNATDDEGHTKHWSITSQELKAQVVKGIKTGNTLDRVLNDYLQGGPNDAVKGIIGHSIGIQAE